MHADARLIRNGAWKRGALEAHQVDVDGIGRQGARMVLHAGGPTQVSEGDDSGSHRSLQNWRSRLAATRALYSAVDRTSSIGAISARRTCCAAAMDAAPASAA